MNKHMDSNTSINKMNIINIHSTSNVSIINPNINTKTINIHSCIHSILLAISPDHINTGINMNISIRINNHIHIHIHAHSHMQTNMKMNMDMDMNIKAAGAADPETNLRLQDVAHVAVGGMSGGKWKKPITKTLFRLHETRCAITCNRNWINMNMIMIINMNSTRNTNIDNINIGININIDINIDIEITINPFPVANGCTSSFMLPEKVFLQLELQPFATGKAAHNGIRNPIATGKPVSGSADPTAIIVIVSII